MGYTKSSGSPWAVEKLFESELYDHGQAPELARVVYFARACCLYIVRNIKKLMKNE